MLRDRAELERRVRELEAEVARLKGGTPRRVRYRSALALGELPFVCVATGPDPAKGETRGHAVGVIAIGDIATGLVALGGLARGVFAFGGLALGVVSFGGLSLGALAAVGGLAVGALAFGGGAVGGAAIGGGAAGFYACGGAAAGAYVVDAARRDPEAVAFFAEYGLSTHCHGERRSSRRIDPAPQ